MKPNSAEWLKYRRDEYEAQRVEMEAEDAASAPAEPPTLPPARDGETLSNEDTQNLRNIRHVLVGMKGMLVPYGARAEEWDSLIESFDRWRDTVTALRAEYERVRAPALLRALRQTLAGEAPDAD